jgi:hypothetical protein
MKYTGNGQLICGSEIIAAGDDIPKKWAKQNPESIKSLEERGMIDGKAPAKNEAKSEELTKREQTATEREEAVEAREVAVGEREKLAEERENALDDGDDKK